MKSHTLSVIAFVVAVAISDAQARYGRLNSYLIEEVPNDEVDLNLKAARKWLEEQQDMRLSFLSRVPTSDLKKFTALQQVIEDTKCDQTAYDIGRANLEAADLRRDSIRRVDKVILKIFEDHARRCMKVYPSRYRAKKAQLDQQLLERIEQIAGTAVRLDLFTPRYGRRYTVIYPYHLFSFYIKNRLTARRLPDIIHILETGLAYNSLGDPDVKYLQKFQDDSGKQVIHRDKIEALIRRHLIEPCQQYEAAMGPDLFIPAEFDVGFHYELDDDRDYYMSWSYFTICRALTSDKSGVLDELISTVARKAS